MQVTIFLKIHELDCLYANVSAESAARLLIEQAKSVRDYWSDGPNVVIECSLVDGLELLRYAQVYCPSAVDKIRCAFRLAELRYESRSNPSGSTKDYASEFWIVEDRDAEREGPSNTRARP